MRTVLVLQVLNHLFCDSCLHLELLANTVGDGTQRLPADTYIDTVDIDLLALLNAAFDGVNGLDGLVDVIDHAFADAVRRALFLIAQHLKGAVGAFLPDDGPDAG